MFKNEICSLLRRNLFEPLDALRSGTPRLRYWKELERSQYLSKSELQNIQWLRLKELLEFIWKSNGFYRERLASSGIKPEDIQSLKDVAKIPVLTKEEVRANTQAMISSGYDTSSLIQFKTGGSTGKSLTIYMTEECSELRNACARRHDRWAGWEPGEPVGALWGNPLLPHDLKSWLRNGMLMPFIYLDTMHVTEGSVRKFAEEWKRVKPTLLYGHAHSIFVLAQYVENLGIDAIIPKGILSTSMMLLPYERKAIESVFGIRVTDRYGCEEVSLIASECQNHEGMHLNIEHLLVEFLKDDGTHAAPGEAGRIIVTDLMNYAMPFIRYQVDDVGVPTDRKCSCLRGLPLMESVTGRVADFLVKKDGTKVAGVSLIENTLTRITGINQMQIVQESLDKILLRLVPGNDYEHMTELRMISYFKELFGKHVEINVEITNEILPESSGKYRFSICRV